MNGVNKEDFDGAQEFMNTSLDMMTDDGETFDLLKDLNGHSNYLYAHCLGVSLYAVMIARRMSLDFPKIHFSVSMAGLFHDIGKREINSYILEKKRASLSQAERAVYETHPNRGAEILDSLNVPPEVVQTVLQHHEDCMGTGYPQRLRKNQIIPIARIIFVANVFCGYAIKNPQSKGFTAEESIKKMESIFGQRIDSVPFMALKEIFGIHVYEQKGPKIVV